MELREHSDGKAITELKEELVKLREAHFGDIHSLEDRVKKAEEKCLAKERK